MTQFQLASLVVQVLDLQRQYFKASGPHKLGLIDECKQAERHLRKVCEEILRPPKPAPLKLFENPEATVD